MNNLDGIDFTGVKINVKLLTGNWTAATERVLEV
jgi:hypothetical protein